MKDRWWLCGLFFCANFMWLFLFWFCRTCHPIVNVRRYSDAQCDYCAYHDEIRQSAPFFVGRDEMFTHPTSPPSIHIVMCFRVCSFIEVWYISPRAPWHLTRPHASTHFCVRWSLCARCTIVLCSPSLRTMLSPSSVSVEALWRSSKLCPSFTQATGRSPTCWTARWKWALWMTACSSMSMTVWMWMRMNTVFPVIGLTFGWSTEDSPCFGYFDKVFWCGRIRRVRIRMVTFTEGVEWSWELSVSISDSIGLWCDGTFLFQPVWHLGWPVKYRSGFERYL